VVEDGQIKLPPGLQLPDGLKVRVSWDDEEVTTAPYDREPLTQEDVQAELQWATGRRFRG
jgi:regulator of sirC expression with transglutaminase-like and TPR domain